MSLWRSLRVSLISKIVNFFLFFLQWIITYFKLLFKSSKHLFSIWNLLEIFIELETNLPSFLINFSNLFGVPKYKFISFLSDFEPIPFDNFSSCLLGLHAFENNLCDLIRKLLFSNLIFSKALHKSIAKYQSGVITIICGSIYFLDSACMSFIIHFDTRFSSWSSSLRLSFDIFNSSPDSFSACSSIM